MRDTDIAYAAGLFDGEGYVGVQKGSDHRSPILIIAVEMTSKSTVSWLSETFGGGCYAQPLRQGRANNQTWQWRLSGSRAAGFLALVLPYLRTKRDQAIVALAFPNGSYRSKPTEAEMDLRKELYFVLREMKKEPI